MTQLGHGLKQTLLGDGLVKQLVHGQNIMGGKS